MSFSDFATDLEVNYIAYFGNAGPARPLEQELDVKHCPGLVKYLRKVNLSLPQFEAMLTGCYPPEMEYQLQPEFPDPGFPPSHHHGGRNIEKIHTEQGLFLATRKSAEGPFVHQVPILPTVTNIGLQIFLLLLINILW
jgi:hypothetical protein